MFVFGSATTTPVRERVEKGARLLDEIGRGGTFPEIDLDILNIATHDKCMLGQLFGTYIAGREAIELAPSLSPGSSGVDYGFVPTPTLSLVPTNDLADLNQAWRDLITERRVAADAREPVLV